MPSFQDTEYRSFSKVGGWNDWVKVGTTSGKPNSTDALTCIQFRYTGVGSFSMEAYMETREWVQFSPDNGFCGDAQHIKTIHAVRFCLANAPGYHIFYRACMEDGNWTHWKRDNDTIGDTVCSHFVVALDVRIVMDEPHLQYRAYIMNTGWTDFVGDNQIVGFEGKGLRMEGLFIHYTGPGRILIRCHVQNYGWMPEVCNDVVCGTEGKGLRMEAIQLRLVDIEGYHIYYSGYIKGMGWQPWMKDGEVLGTEGKSMSLEALRIRIAM